MHPVKTTKDKKTPNKRKTVTTRKKTTTKAKATKTTKRQAKRQEVKIANVFDRYLAKGIDLIIISFVAFVLSGISVVFSFFISVIYALIIDAYPKLSLGKMAINLRVVDQNTNEPISLKQSAIRNSPFALMIALSLIPIFGWILMMVVTIPIMILESYLLYNLESHERLGDVIANTKVIEIDVSKSRK